MFSTRTQCLQSRSNCVLILSSCVTFGADTGLSSRHSGRLCELGLAPLRPQLFCESSWVGYEMPTSLLCPLWSVKHMTTADHRGRALCAVTRRVSPTQQRCLGCRMGRPLGTAGGTSFAQISLIQTVIAFACFTH